MAVGLTCGLVACFRRGKEVGDEKGVSRLLKLNEKKSNIDYYSPRERDTRARMTSAQKSMSWKLRHQTDLRNVI